MYGIVPGDEDPKAQARPWWEIAAGLGGPLEGSKWVNTIAREPSPIEADHHPIKPGRWHLFRADRCR